MPKRHGRAIEILAGEQAVLRADYFGIEPEQAAQGKLILIATPYEDGGTAAILLSEFAPEHLMDAARDAIRLSKKGTVFDRAYEVFVHIKNKLRDVRGPPQKRLRLKPGEIRF